MNLDNFDAILYMTPMINENDERVYTTGSPDYTWKGAPEGQPDFNLIGAYTFGKTIRTSLSGLPQGFYNKVIDYGKYIIATIGYHNILTGRSAEKTFLIVFNSDKGNGNIFSTSNRYRSINGVQQAISYIRSASQSLQNQTNNRS